MNEEIEVERIKLTNYILQKENEILLGTIGIMAREKEQMLEEKEQILKELEANKQTINYKLKRKVKNGIKKIIRSK